MTNNFFAILSRMKYIERWALMRSSRAENLSEHSLEVAMIAHALCEIGNTRYGHSLDAPKAALIGLYHDASEIITGDMPTPVKYYNEDIRSAYKAVEAIAEDHLLEKLPEDIRPAYESIFHPVTLPDDFDLRPPREQESIRKQLEDDRYLRALVKAADRISALIKCMEEENAGNSEFRTAMETTRLSVEALAVRYPEVKDFVEQFLPPYGSTLDELTKQEKKTI